MKNATEENTYSPGSCNIGPEEVKRRYRIGFTGLALMAVYVLCVEWLDLQRIVKLGLFFPAFYAVSGFLQAVRRFCFVYGWKGVASLGGRRKFKHVTDEVYLRQDRNMAITFVVIVTLGSVILTVVYFLLPL